MKNELILKQSLISKKLEAMSSNSNALMNEQKRIKVDYIARVEGQGALDIKFSNGKVEELKLQIYEPPRFFEAFLIGRGFDEVHELTSRICGICHCAHQITALQAVENAIGVTVSQQTKDLRKLLALGGIIQSHALHLYFLAAPDYLGYESAISMIPDRLPLVKRGLELKKLGNDIVELIGGRAIHPVTAMINGFTALPKERDLEALKKRLKEAKADAIHTVELFTNLKIPNFQRKCEYVALSHPTEYAINEGKLVSSEGLDIAPSEYRKYFKERQVPHSYAKRSSIEGRSSFMVGPLARMNINFQKLSSDAKSMAKEAGFKPPNFNPFSNNLARAIEILHFIDECIEIIEHLDLRETNGSFEARAGEGFAITEAPRGSLYHYYKFDKDGIVEKADIVTPTAHNVYNIEQDLLHFAPNVIDLPLEDATLKCEMLIRAYDPCISCSVHFLKLNIRKDERLRSGLRLPKNKRGS